MNIDGFLNSLKPPCGHDLTGNAQIKFLELERAFHASCNGMLVRPNMEAMITCSDLVNNTLNPIVLVEFVELIKRKLASTRDPRVFLLILSLIDILVKNGRVRWYSAMNNDEFMSELAKVARKFSNLSGADNVAVKELVLDMIQAWGEGFLPYSDRYPAMPKIYHQLRKEGLPFKQQYDPSRVPIFTPISNPNGTNTNNINGESRTQDHVLSASLEAQIPGLPSTELPRTAAAVSSSSSSSSSSSLRNNRNSTNINRSSASNSDSLDNIVTELTTYTKVLKEIIIAALSFESLNNDGTGMELADMINSNKESLQTKQEQIIMCEPSKLESIFALIEDATNLVDSFKEIDNNQSLQRYQLKLKNDGFKTNDDDDSNNANTSGNGSNNNNNNNNNSGGISNMTDTFDLLDIGQGSTPPSVFTTQSISSQPIQQAQSPAPIVFNTNISDEQNNSVVQVKLRDAPVRSISKGPITRLAPPPGMKIAPPLPSLSTTTAPTTSAADDLLSLVSNSVNPINSMTPMNSVPVMNLGESTMPMMTTEFPVLQQTTGQTGINSMNGNLMDMQSNNINVNNTTTSKEESANPFDLF